MPRIAKRLVFRPTGVDPDKHLVFGWASVVTKGGKPVVDRAGDVIPVEVLEEAVYRYMLDSRDASDGRHEKRGVGKCVESCVLTLEKQRAIGIDLGFEGWFCGFKITDPDVWDAIKAGRQQVGFSIGGRAVGKEL